MTIISSCKQSKLRSSRRCFGFLRNVLEEYIPLIEQALECPAKNLDCKCGEGNSAGPKDESTLCLCKLRKHLFTNYLFTIKSIASQLFEVLNAIPLYFLSYLAEYYT